MAKRPLLGLGSPAEDSDPSKRARRGDEHTGIAPRPNVNLHNGSAPESISENNETTVESILERNKYLHSSQPIRIDIDMFLGFDQSNTILIKLVQLYHSVAGGMERTQQAEYLAMLHADEWRYVGSKHADRGPSSHNAFRTLRNKDKHFHRDKLTFNTLAILVASCTEDSHLDSLRKLMVFKAYHIIGVRYTVCPAVYSHYSGTGLEPWTPPDIDRQALATEKEPKFVGEVAHELQDHHSPGNEPRREETPYDRGQANSMAAAITDLVEKEVKCVGQERKKEDEERHRRISEATKFLKVEALAALLENLLEQ
ncbi:hypothetical protein NLG97_g7696 [Lecanicillium saksenae]|uniref:Uncharacterized protein n=1 Tax=Lecanicillium saksenae TaxID=468837 RepID=A0ACC1QL46_9HYPO|nr:hypothetical protein NLG97_g7696 [Lecanicillium saksenae]